MMANVHASIVLLIALAVVGCVFASPIQFQEESGTLRQDAYPSLQYLGRYFDDRSGHPLKRNLDQIGGGNLVKRTEDGGKLPKGEFFSRNLDHIGGGNLLRSVVDFPRDGVQGSLEQVPHPYQRSEESKRYLRNLDPIGGGNLVRSINQNDEKSFSVVQTDDGILIRYD